MAELVVALDVDNEQAALNVARQLRGTVDWLKVGLELFTVAGPQFVRRLEDEGFRIFLDLKFYDIPNTVTGAVRAACELQVGMLTLHCQGGERMCRAAAEAAARFGGSSRPLLFGVTVLTSFAAGEMPGINLKPEDFGRNLAAMAAGWGLDGVVCSGHEAAAIKKNNPNLLCLCPGIRPGGQTIDDQRRIMTPAMAVASGADFLVVGRPILQAASPLAAAGAILDEMRKADVQSG